LRQVDSTPFDPKKLERIRTNLEKQGVTFVVGAEAEKELRRAKASAMYTFKKGKPGEVHLSSSPTAPEVVEELIHLGQARKSNPKWAVPSDVELARFELAAQKQLIRLGKRLGWTETEQAATRAARKLWKADLKAAEAREAGR